MFGFVCVCFLLFISFILFFWRCVHFFTWFVRIIIKDGANSSERTKRVRAIIIKRVFVDFALVASCTRNHNQKLPEKHFRGYNCYSPGIFFILRSCRFKFYFFLSFHFAVRCIFASHQNENVQDKQISCGFWSHNLFALFSNSEASSS